MKLITIENGADSGLIEANTIVIYTNHKGIGINSRLICTNHEGIGVNSRLIGVNRQRINADCLGIVAVMRLRWRHFQSESG